MGYKAESIKALAVTSAEDYFTKWGNYRPELFLTHAADLTSERLLFEVRNILNSQDYRAAG